LHNLQFSTISLQNDCSYGRHLAKIIANETANYRADEVLFIATSVHIHKTAVVIFSACCKPFSNVRSARRLHCKMIHDIAQRYAY